MSIEGLTDWLERYFAAWRSNDPDEIAALFAADAVYSYGPFREPSIGRDAIVRRRAPPSLTDMSRSPPSSTAALHIGRSGLRIRRWPRRALRWTGSWS
jgi:hypothetical protein